GVGDGHALVSKHTVRKCRCGNRSAGQSSGGGKLYFEAVAVVTGNRVVPDVLSGGGDVKGRACALWAADRIEGEWIDRCIRNRSKCYGVACSCCQRAPRAGR